MLPKETMIDTSNLSPGLHTIFVESQDANGNFSLTEQYCSVGTNLDSPLPVDTVTEDTDLFQVPYSNLVVFGDSLSDTENVFNATEGLIPHAEGRFSNGDLIVDAMSEPSDAGASRRCKAAANHLR